MNFFQHLNNLLENYLEPLKKETFLSNAEINALFGNIQEIVTFQRQFLQNLEEALELEPDFHKFEHSSQFKVIILLLISSPTKFYFIRSWLLIILNQNNGNSLVNPSIITILIINRFAYSDITSV